MSASGVLDARTRSFYEASLRLLVRSQIPFMVGGAYALERYTGVARHTKDLDVFVRKSDCRAILDLFDRAGYRTERPFPHWLAKAHQGDAFIDFIYNGGNGLTAVDAGWLEHAIDDEVFGVEVKLCPPEEMIWSKAFIMDRERYDGADVSHLLLSQAPRLDWNRLLMRFGPQWRVLLSHLILFGFAYPDRRALIPAPVLSGLLHRLEQEPPVPLEAAGVCQGTLLSREQYLDDIERHGLRDARLAPLGHMSPEDIAIWTAAIDADHGQRG